MIKISLDTEFIYLSVGIFSVYVNLWLRVYSSLSNCKITLLVLMFKYRGSYIYTIIYEK